MEETLEAFNNRKLIKAICIKRCDNQMYPSIDCFENNLYFIDINYGNVYYYSVYDLDNKFIGAFDRDCFILLSDYREKQINEILDI